MDIDEFVPLISIFVKLSGDAGAEVNVFQLSIQTELESSLGLMVCNCTLMVPVSSMHLL